MDTKSMETCAQIAKRAHLLLVTGEVASFHREWRMRQLARGVHEFAPLSRNQRLAFGVSDTDLDSWSFELARAMLG